MSSQKDVEACDLQEEGQSLLSSAPIPAALTITNQTEFPDTELATVLVQNDASSSSTGWRDALEETTLDDTEAVEETFDDPEAVEETFDDTEAVEETTVDYADDVDDGELTAEQRDNSNSPLSSVTSQTSLEFRRRYYKSIDIRLHDASYMQDEDAVQRLIAAGASVAAFDYVGITPLHQCIANKQIKSLEMLLKYEGSVEVKDANGWSLLHAAIVHKWPAGVRALLKAGADVSYLPRPKRHRYDCVRKYGYSCVVTSLEYFTSLTKTPLHLAVEMDETEIFDSVVEVADQNGFLHCLDQNGQTPLFHAIEFGNLRAVKILLGKGVDITSKNRENKTVLHVAVRKPHVLKHLINNTPCQEAVSSYDNNGDAPIHSAVRLKAPESVRLLLEKFNNPHFKNLRSNQTALHIAAEFGSNEAAEIILDYDKDTMNDIDLYKDRPLHIAAKHNNRVVITTLIRKGDVLATGLENKTAVELISIHFSDASSFFEQIFDECIKAKKVNDCYEVNVDYQVLTNDTNTDQIGVIEEFVKCDQSSVLIHPLIESLLYLKWCQLLPLFYSLVTVFLVFLTSLNIFVVNVYYQGDQNNDTSLNSCNNPPWFDFYDGRYWVLVTLIYASIILLVVQESFHIYLRWLRYFTHLESWVKICGLALGALTPATACLQLSWPRHVACAALLLGWLQAMFLLAQVPYWGNYILMFGKVATNMLKVFVTSVFLVIAFSLCFLIQYESTPPFDGPFVAFIKTLVMMSSEFDYENLVGEDHGNELKDTKTIVRLLLVLFQFFLVIVLMNFMVGVAVSDISELNTTGNISRLEKQVQLLSTLEFLIFNGTQARLLWVKIINTFGIPKFNRFIWNISFVHGKQTNNHVTTQDSSKQKTNRFYIPSTVLKAIVGVAMRKMKEVKRDSAESVREYKIDALYDAIVDKSVVTEEKIEKSQNDSISLREMISRQDKQIHILSVDLQKQINDLRSDIMSIKTILIKKT